MQTLFGRAAEHEALCALIAQGARLVTVLGPGGSGKTTLARSVPHGCFVDLSACHTADEALGVIRGEVGEPIEVRVAELEGVLILDNCEQVEGLSTLLATWEGPIVATSRIPLQVHDEHRLYLDGLDRDAARALLEDCVGRWGRSTVTPEQADRIIDQLDGLPLAIELAASRVGLLGANGVATMLDDPLRVLADRKVDRAARHRSLDKTLRVSWELLSPEARALLTRVSLFSGAFTLVDAQVCFAEVHDASTVMDALEELVDASLVRSVEGRFRLFLGVREFAVERGAPADIPRHCAWVLSQEPGPERLAEALRAIHRCAEGSTVVALSLWADKVLQRTGPVGLRCEVLERARGLPEGGARVDVGLRLARAYLSSMRTGLASEVLAGLGVSADPELAGDVLTLRVQLALTRHDLDGARAAATQAIAHFRALDDGDKVAINLVRLAAAETLSGRLDEALAALDGAIEAAGREAEAYGLAQDQKGICLLELGHLEEARAATLEARTAFVARGETARVGHVEAVLGMIALELGRFDEARSWLDSALEHDRAAQDPRWLIYRALQLAYVNWLDTGASDPESLDRLIQTLGRTDLLGLEDLALLMASLIIEDRMAARYIRESIRPRVPSSMLGPVMLEALLLVESLEGDHCDAQLAALASRDPAPTELRILALGVQRRFEGRVRLEIGDGWFRLDGALVDLRTRANLRRLLLELARHLEGPALSVEELFEAAWPGQQAMPESRANRVYSALTSLRRMGLADLLLREDGGYRLQARDCRRVTEPPWGRR